MKEKEIKDLLRTGRHGKMRQRSEKLNYIIVKQVSHQVDVTSINVSMPAFKHLNT